MKAVTFALLLVVLVALAQAAPVENLDSKWEDFKKTHKKVYGSVEEENRRKDIFSKNLAKIEEHNQKFAAGEVTFEQGVNEYTDLTSDEFSVRLGVRDNSGHGTKGLALGVAH